MKIQLAVVTISVLILGGCFDSRQRDPSDETGTANGRPTISGSPPTAIRAGEIYEFTPSASDPDGDALTFRIANKPSWASFDAATGRLAGRPALADAGVVTDIKISVSDGTDRAALGRFSIKVHQISTGSATLSWQPPMQNVDGTVLADLSGYRIYYGRRADSLDQVITLDNPGLTRYVIENLSQATWHFAMTSYNSQGMESPRSATASKTIS